MNSSKNKISVCAVIPFYNEKDFIRNVVIETSKCVDFICAVDDGSVDGSAGEISNLPNLKIITLDKNYGKGFALQKGFKFCVDENFDVIVTLDADGQHNPAFITDLITKLKFFDIVIGNRLKKIKVMPIQRIISNKLTSKLITLKTGQNILDSQCGFRAYKKAVLEKCRTESKGFEAESEIIIKAANEGFKIGHADIDTIYGTEKSKMKSIPAIFGFIRVLLKYD